MSLLFDDLSWLGRFYISRANQSLQIWESLFDRVYVIPKPFGLEITFFGRIF